MSFNLFLTIPTEDMGAQVNAALQTLGGSCDLQCFIGALEAGTYAVSTQGGETFTDGFYAVSLGSPVNQSIKASTYLGNPTRALGFGGNINVTGPVPEPGTWALMLLGFGAIGWAMRRQKIRAALASA